MLLVLAIPPTLLCLIYHVTSKAGLVYLATIEGYCFRVLSFEVMK